MHTVISYEKYKEILEVVSKICVKNPSLPILQNILIEAKDGVMTCRATNLEIGIEGKIEDIKIIEPGIVLVNANTLLQTISLIKQKEVELQTEEGVLVIKAGKSKTKLKTIPYEDFPPIPSLEGDGITIIPKQIAYGIKTAAFAASQNAIKPELGCVYIYQKRENSLTFVATDSFRLIEKTVLMQGFVFSNKILIPYKNALEIARIMDLYGDEDISLYIHEDQCSIISKKIKVISRLIAGNFPDYEQIIPKEYMTHTTLLVSDLLFALKKTNIFLNKFSQLTLSISNGVLTLLSKGDDGTTEEQIPISQEGNDITISVNQKYLQEVLSHITDDSIIIHFTGLGRPMVLEGVYDKSLRYLVMPMNR